MKRVKVEFTRAEIAALHFHLAGIIQLMGCDDNRERADNKLLKSALAKIDDASVG